MKQRPRWLSDGRLLALLVIAGIAIKVPIAIFYLQGFGIDESIYIATARDYAETGVFGIRTESNDFGFIAPMLSFLMAGFYKVFGESGPLMVAPIFGSLTVIPFYYIGKSLIGPAAGRLAAVLVFFNPAFFLLNTRPLTETLGFFMMSTAVMFLVLGFKDRRNWIAVLPLFLMTFLTRYPYGILLIAFVVLALLFQKSVRQFLCRYSLVGLVLAVLIAAPWMAYNQTNYGTLLGGPAKQGSADIGFDFLKGTWYIPYAAIVLGATFPFAVYGFFRSIRERKNVLMLIGVAVIFLVQFAMFSKTVEERYILPVLLFATMLSVFGYDNMRGRMGKWVGYALVGMLILNALAAVYAVNLFAHLPKYSDTRDALLWVKDNCDGELLANLHTPVYNILGRDALHPTFTDDGDRKIVESRNVRCVIATSYEAPYKDFFQNLSSGEKVSFGKINVYKIK